jgi:RNA polymerase sigma-70 factor (ECF subfamily)
MQAKNAQCGGHLLRLRKAGHAGNEAIEIGRPVTPMNQVYAEIGEIVPHLRRYASALCRDPVAADDLVQESIARALKKSHLFKSGTNLRAWVFTIMHNLNISDIRRRKLMGSPIDPDIAAATLSVPPMQELSLEVNALIRAMKGIPDKQRVAVLMVGVDGVSYERASGHLKVPVGTVKSRVSRGRDALRLAMEGREIRRFRSAVPKSAAALERKGAPAFGTGARTWS